MRRTTPIIALLLVTTLAVPAGAEVTDEDIARAREKVQELLADSEALGREVQEAWGRQFALEREIDNLASSIELTQVKIVEAEGRLQDLAVEMYMGTASVASIQVIFSAPNEEAYGAGVEYLRNVSGDTDEVVGQLRAYRDELDVQSARLAAATEEQVALLAELEAKAGELQQRLGTAQSEYERLVAQQAAEEEARRRAEEEARRQAEEEARNATTTTTQPAGTTVTTTPVSSGGEDTSTTAPPTTSTPAPTGGGTCPVAGAVSFTDTWGAPRSGGRTHKGVDMIAARNTPIVAIRDGTVSRLSNGSLSGLAVWFRASDGDLFFYAHLESFGDVSAGQSVPAGHVLGYNGSSGNAPEWLPHLHFQYHPGGGAPVNPYPLVRSIC